MLLIHVVVIPYKQENEQIENRDSGHIHSHGKTMHSSVHMEY